MGFHLSAEDPGAAAAVRRIATERIDAAAAALARGDAAGVHAARKRLKELRALVALAAPALRGARREARAFRDAGRALSGTRDAAVLAATFDHLVAHARTVLDAATNERVRTHLAPPAEGAGAAEAAAILAAARERVATWRIEDRFTALAEGAGDTYAAARRRMKRAGESDAAMHDWRKAVKAHAAHLKLLTPLAPELLKGQEKAVSRLGEILGDHHDLTVLAARLGEVPGTAPLVRLVEERRAALAADAAPLGARLFAERPDAFADRLRRLHKASRPAPALAA